MRPACRDVASRHHASGLKASALGPTLRERARSEPSGGLFDAEAASIALGKSVALDCAAIPIRVNAIVLGPFDTPMLRSTITKLAEGDHTRIQEVERQYEGLVPLGRIGRPEEAAAAIAWLRSESSSFATVRSVIVDGGMTSFAR